jgi:hypothetical protein
MIGRSTIRSTGQKGNSANQKFSRRGQLVAYGGGPASSKVCASINAASAASAVAEQTNRRTRQAPLVRLARAVAAAVEAGQAGCFCTGCAVSELVAPELSANPKEVSAEKCDSLPGPMSVRRARFYWNTWKRGWASNEKTEKTAPIGPFEAIFC